MRPRYVIVALALIGATVSWPACAKSPLYIQECNNNGGQFSPVEQITGCTNVILLGRFRGENLAQAYNNRGSAYANDGAYDRAIKDFNRAIAADPKYVAAFNNRGLTYRRKGEFDRAIRDFTLAIKLDSKDAFAFNNRGLAYASKGQNDRAIHDYNQAIGLQPNFAFAFNNRGLAYANSGQYDRAIQDYTQAINLDPKGAVVFNNRGLANASKGQYDHAIQDYTQAIKLNPNFAYAFQGRGRVNFYLRRMPQALADFNQAIELVPTDAYTALWRDIVSRHSKVPSRLGREASQINMKKWPAPIIRLYLDQFTPAAVLAAANDPNAKTKRGHVCEANFYTGELALTQDARDKAKRLLRLATSDCPKTFVEYTAAAAELKRLVH
jgi:lipoprotein NlpI